jgi:pyruvate dehydrogenase E1 component
VVTYTGCLAPEAAAAVDALKESGTEAALLAVTSADRLHAGWSAASRASATSRSQSHIERLLAPLNPRCRIVTVMDGHPAALAWLGSVNGHRCRGLGVEHFGQTGSIDNLYRHYGIDAEAIIMASRQ